MAGNDEQRIVLSVNPGTWLFNINNLSHQISISVLLLKTIHVSYLFHHEKADIVEPLEKQKRFFVKQGYKLLLKIRTNSSFGPNSTINLNLMRKNKNNKVSFLEKIQLKIHSFPVILPSPQKYLLIQGNLWPIPQEISKCFAKNELEITKEMLNLLVHQYYFNAFSGSPVRKQLYKKYLSILFKNFSPSYVRITFKMSNRKRYRKFTINEIKGVIKEIPSYPVHTLLGIKLWDEPLPANLSQVIYDYTKAKHILKKFKTELSFGIPVISYKLWSLIDIFVVSPHSLSAFLCYIYTHPNKKILLYANRNHSDYEDARKMQFIGWTIYKYRIDGYHFWGINLWKQECGE